MPQQYGTFEDLVRDVKRNPQQLARYQQDPRLLAFLRSLCADLAPSRSKRSLNAKELKFRLDRDVAANARDPIPRIRYATHLQQQNDHLQAQKMWESLVALYTEANDDAGAARAYHEIARCHLALGNLSEAVGPLELSLFYIQSDDVSNELKRIQKLLLGRSAAAFESVDKARAATKRAMDAVQNGQIVPAFEQFREAIRRAPRDPQMYLNRAEAYGMMAEHGLAIRDLEKALELPSPPVRALRLVAQCYRAVGDAGKALQSYMRVLEGEKDDAEALQGIAELAESLRPRQEPPPEAVEVLPPEGPGPVAAEK
jgi:tetratricopeptide (TPR) repeat protein